MGALVLDIETYGAKAVLPASIRARMEASDLPEPALSPFTGQILVIGVHAVDDAKTTVMYVDDKPPPAGGVPKVVYPNERELLAGFWAAVGRFQPIVTFNGRAFDLPFIMIRSAVCGVRPARNLVGYRYSLRSECDISDALTFYGASRRPTLEAACWTFGIASPKGAIDGSKVGEAYEAGRIVEIAEYCGRDVEATAALYRMLVGTLLPVLTESRG